MWPFQKKPKEEAKKKRAYYLAAKEDTKEREIEIMASKVRWAIQQSPNKELVFLCIGSDRSTGDALGPFVGSMLKQNKLSYPVYGTLKSPVHALNLGEVMKELKENYENPMIFAIDACLGDEERIGYILFKEEPLIPGHALNKSLPQVGQLHMRAIVNYLDPLSPAQSLNDTRLYTVIHLAGVITDIIMRATSTEEFEE
ncbi:spore protease YyaC [Bacillus thermotolerans]|uniref:Spore protease GPR related protein n=1 Tax=Bacillus thermotolerans TaxID=1221996 RepID=A0A0F5I653_BACTR|nr:spore protease YyaC [Bacillus thermotolerans]KKB40637.1 Spore protease GPR related protein [Bacillus thermotolerans]KKB41297.1 Spore protease GPR related protein [Bacillus thermotolerans]